MKDKKRKWKKKEEEEVFIFNSTWNSTYISNKFNSYISSRNQAAS
jgi:hypothetical protein